MSKKIEEVAMAICAACIGGKRCPCEEIGKFSCIDDMPGIAAKAAIGAMVEPTDEMLEAAHPGNAPTEFIAALARTVAKDDYILMVKSILKEGEK